MINTAKKYDSYDKDFNALYKLVKERSFEFGDFTLSSGKKSNYYFDSKQVTLSPEGLYLIGRIIIDKIRDLNINAVGGLAIGADPITCGLGVVSYLEGMNNLNLFIVRKDPKKHGKFKLIEGPTLNVGDRVVIIDDVITTGGSVLDAIKAVKEIGCEVVKVITLVDRKEGGTEIINAMGIEVDPIFDIANFINE